MDIHEEVEKIKRQLGLNEEDGEQNLLISELFQGWSGHACAICHVKEPTEAMIPMIRDVTAAAWLRRGTEGANSYSAGGQSYSYTDLYGDFSNRLIQAGLRVFSP